MVDRIGYYYTLQEPNEHCHFNNLPAIVVANAHSKTLGSLHVHKMTESALPQIIIIMCMQNHSDWKDTCYASSASGENSIDMWLKLKAYFNYHKEELVENERQRCVVIKTVWGNVQETIIWDYANCGHSKCSYSYV